MKLTHVLRLSYNCEAISTRHPPRKDGECFG